MLMLSLAHILGWLISAALKIFIRTIEAIIVKIVSLLTLS